MNFNIENIVRENIKKMKPYSSARHEFTGDAHVFLDANENAFGSPLFSEVVVQKNYHRYPDPLQHQLKDKISKIKGVPPQHIFLGNGSDEAIDLLFRIFCEPGKDNVVIFPPTYGMYEVCAELNNVGIKKIPLTSQFQLNLDLLASEIDSFTKIIFVCSPNNPTGNSIYYHDIEILLNNFEGIVVVDEAYINFSKQKSFITALTEYSNLVIMQTLSKAWGLAALRLGMAFASLPVINYMNKVKYPYNINTATQEIALQALENIDTMNDWTRQLVAEREQLSLALQKLPCCENVFPSDANFVLIKMKDANKIYSYLAEKGIIVRNRSNVILCDNCLRITVGTPVENQLLLSTLKGYNK